MKCYTMANKLLFSSTLSAHLLYKHMKKSWGPDGEFSKAISFLIMKIGDISSTIEFQILPSYCLDSAVAEGVEKLISSF